MQSTIIKKKLIKIFKERPSVSVPNAISLLESQNTHNNSRPVRYYLKQLKENNYFSLASKFF